MDAPPIWISGDWQHADFAAAVRWLAERAGLVPVSVEECRHEAPLPHAILVCESRPGQFSRGCVQGLQARAPLARVVALLGPWCEGERSGRPWLGVVHVPWRNWQQRLPRALGIIPQSIRLPRTATEAERLALEIAALRRHPAARPAATVGIRTASRAWFEGLRGVLSEFGGRGRWLLNHEPARSGTRLEIVDGWDHWPAAPGAPRVLLLHFPRCDDFARAEQLGAYAVLAQPLLLPDFAAAVEGLLPQSAAAARLPIVA
jgi:hypothetical protein